MQWQVLDSYETENVLLLNKDQKLNNKDFTLLFLDRLRELSPKLAEIFRQNLNQLDRQSRWLSGVDLGPVDDSLHFVLPKGCSLKQAAIQLSGAYLFNADIWDQLSDLEKNILISHELLYRSILQYSTLEDSRPVRALNGLLISTEFSKMTTDKRQDFLKAHQIELP